MYSITVKATKKLVVISFCCFLVLKNQKEIRVRRPHQLVSKKARSLKVLKQMEGDQCQSKVVAFNGPTAGHPARLAGAGGGVRDTFFQGQRDDDGGGCVSSFLVFFQGGNLGCVFTPGAFFFSSSCEAPYLLYC